MYLPGKYRETDEAEIFQLIRRYPFATIITQDGAVPYVNHLPILLETTNTGNHLLIGHLARSNPQMKHLETEQSATVVFHGPHTYMTPRWYVDQENVPTWNYATVHVRGKTRITSSERLREILDKTVFEFEKDTAKPWTFSENPELSVDFREGLSKAIAGFEITMDHIDAKFKLGQNREILDFEGALRGLGERKDDMSREVLELMLKRKK
jgi:transcriptional regulator